MLVVELKTQGGTDWSQDVRRWFLVDKMILQTDYCLIIQMALLSYFKICEVDAGSKFNSLSL